MSDDDLSVGSAEQSDYIGWFGQAVSIAKPFTYIPAEDRTLRLSSASLTHEAKANARASLLIHASDSQQEPITITTLTAQRPSTSLDLYLLGGQEITLSVKGNEVIHVAGYVTEVGAPQYGLDDYDEEEMYEDLSDEDGVADYVLRKRLAARMGAASTLDDDDDDDDEDSDFVEIDDSSEFDENEDDVDVIQARMADKIRVLGTDEEASEEEEQQQPAKKPATKGGKNVPKASPQVKGKTGKSPTPSPQIKPQPVEQPKPSPLQKPTPAKNGATNQQTPASKRKIEPENNLTANKKQKQADATPAKPAPQQSQSQKNKTPASAAKTIRCTHEGCGKSFTSELALKQHINGKHK